MESNVGLGSEYLGQRTAAEVIDAILERERISVPDEVIVTIRPGGVDVTKLGTSVLVTIQDER